MGFEINAEVLQSIFVLPDPDGRYTPELENYFSDIASRRKIALFSFPPKCGGTFLRSAAVAALKGQIYRACYSQGGGEMQFYLPVFLWYFCNFDMPQMVTHVHMQARMSCRNFIRQFNMKPVTMIRSVPDMLVSCRDMFLNDPNEIRENMMCAVPEVFRIWGPEKQADFMICMLAPWYFSYLSSWITYAREEPERVLLLHFEDFRASPTDALMKSLAHFGLPQTRETCESATKLVWANRQKFRYNKGENGRGKDFFSSEHFKILEKMFAQYPALAGYHDELL